MFECSKWYQTIQVEMKGICLTLAKRWLHENNPHVKLLKSPKILLSYLPNKSDMRYEGLTGESSLNALLVAAASLEPPL
jgi:hypothetical protein